MTLIAVMMNAQYAVQVSDRALSENGALLPTTLTKGSVLTCDDARLLVGFTGLAQVGSFQTTPWLLTTLSDLAHRSHQAVDICKRFVDAATETFRRDARIRRLPAEARRMTFIFTGFRYLERNRYQPVSLLVTNFQDWDRGYDDPGAWREFKPLYITPRRDIDWDEFAYVERIGAWPALGETEVAPIRRLVKERRPPAAAVGKAVEVLRKAADHPSCRGSVSKDLVSVVLPANPEWDPSSVFHPVAASEVTYFPNFVDARQGGGMTAWGIEFRVESGGPPVAVPKVGRNEPCRCGSGKKYKRCHGR